MPEASGVILCAICRHNSFDPYTMSIPAGRADPTAPAFNESYMLRCRRCGHVHVFQTARDTAVLIRSADGTAKWYLKDSPDLPAL